MCGIVIILRAEFDFDICFVRAWVEYGHLKFHAVSRCVTLRVTLGLPEVALTPPGVLLV